MADKRDDTRDDAHKGPRRKKRVAPTIDLTAQEVKPVPPVPPPPAAEPERVEPSPAAGAGAKVADGKNETRRKAGIGGAIFAGGLAGAVIAALVMLAVWFTGLVPVRDAGPGASSNRVAALEKQIQDLQNRPVTAVDTKAIDALRQRLLKIENEIAALPPGDKSVAERLSTADNAMKSLGVAVTALNTRTDDTAANATKARDSADAAAKAVADLRVSMEAMKLATTGMSPAELDALQKRIAALEQSAKTARDDIAKAATSDTAARLALSAASLRNAIISGAPFAAELAETKALGADDKALAPLTPFAASGVPSATTLAHDLSALIPVMVKAAGAQAPSGGFLERLQANAGKLVRVRPVDAPPGDDTSAVLARIELAAAKADIAVALADLEKLPDATRAPAQSWIEKAKARQVALAAARQLATDTAHALGPRAGAQ